ncbi:translocation/assembly module TamB domain-containing protein [Zobellia galactanivorans]|uniref:translocation/assembly module TamB domain-containing protein n=1 Tax=Zobellia galactanivorans (strain DSM 12802 / CCUG 47099 / CIP 106680 / NCIMB 13871 / Dsij) TaxID=63186 RepID=UPI0026E2B0BA|nr:translocation/assembly module TamB [Zobellia galactanivorans]MDO6810432.1 translocation/assembly module TamB domain-containing protein [Zobellia galactanivorans]
MQEEKRKYRWLRRFGRVSLVLVLLFLALVLFIRSQWGQDLIVGKLTDYVSQKTNTKVTIDRLFLTFSGNLFLEGLYLEDTKGDTLAYSKNLEVNLALRPLIFGNELNLKSATWEGLRANVHRAENTEDFNFTFLVDAFAAADTTTVSTDTEPMKIRIGELHFTDFKVDYHDAYLGMDGRIRLGKLLLDADETDLEKLRFEIDGFQLSDTEIFYRQTKAFSSEDTTQTSLPYLAVDHLQFNNVKADYASVPDSTFAHLNFSSFELELPKADLATNTIEVDRMAIKGSSLALHLPSDVAAVDSTETDVPDAAFEWPKFSVRADGVDFENNTIVYTRGRAQAQKGDFDPNAISLSEFKLQAGAIRYQPRMVQMDLKALSFIEKSGIVLRNLAFGAEMDDTSAALEGLQLRLNESALAGEMTLGYPSLEKLMDTPGQTEVDMALGEVYLDLNDVFTLQPQLADNTYLKSAAQHPVQGAIMAEGTLEEIDIKNMQLNWGKTTQFIARGSLQNITRTDALFFNFNTIRLNTVKADIAQFVSEKELGISLPQTVAVDAEARGEINDLRAQAKLVIPEGTIAAKGDYQEGTEMRFKGDLKVDGLQLDKLLNNPKLGGVSFTMDVSGGGDVNNLDAKLKADFSQLRLNDYDFSALKLEGDIQNGKGAINLSFKDDNLNFTAQTKVLLDSVSSGFDVDLNMIGADLYALGLTKEDIKAGLQMNAQFKGNAEVFNIEAQIENGVAVYDNEQYQLGGVQLSSSVDPAHTGLSLDSDFLTARLESNASPQGLGKALRQQFENYFKDSLAEKSETDSVKVKMNLKLSPTPILTEVFLRGVERLDSLLVEADFDARTKKMNADVFVPSLAYQGSSIDSLGVQLRGTATDLNFSAGFGGLVFEPIRMEGTYITGNLKNKELLLDFVALDGKEEMVHVSSVMTLSKDTTLIRIDPSNLLLNKKKWTLPQDNQIAVGEKLLRFRKLSFSRNEQELTISNSMEGVEKEHIGIGFDNFKLQTFLSLLNPDENLASGLVKGDLVIENPFGATGLVADFKINSLEALENPLGNLSLKANSTGVSAYDFNLALKDGGVDLDLVGDYAAAEKGALLNLDLDLNRIELGKLQGFTKGALKDAHGAISGRINVSGTTASPEYKGVLDFNGVDFNVASLNAVFKISEEQLKLDTEGIYFDGFQVTDADGSAFTVQGGIGTQSLLNPSFDLKLNAEKFRVLNSTEKDNELFYGEASLDADIAVQGDLELPKITGKLRIRKVTDITYVVPESQLDVEERDGVVLFVNRENPDAILTRNDQEEVPSFFQGMDVRTVLEIAEDADFHVIIDERTGDNLEVSGEAALNLNIEPNGRMNLTGRYELKSGHYETNLYNLVKRRFEINPGSTITWQGDPANAKLDVTAVYKVETSAAPLMATVTSSEDLGVSSQYQQVLPFLVYLNVDGELLQPELSFGLDMPEDEQGSLGGAVYGRVQQLNGQEAELNKQVFSLLALNRFYPDSGSDGSLGGTAAIARDNVNKVLSGELNAFSDKVFGSTGLEVDFDLDSFTDYQGDTPQDRTQLNINAKKKLFDDRLVVTAGSAVDVEGSAQSGQEQTPIIGNVSLEYLLTQDGRYRLKGFRKSEYENIVDGQLIVTGMAVIFNREFNKFSQLFNPLKKETGTDKKKNKTKETQENQ